MSEPADARDQRAATIPVALLDANVLYGQFLRDALLRLAAAGLFAPRWTNRIHDEWTRNLLANYPDLPPARLALLRERMEQAFPDALAEAAPDLEERFSDVDQKDRHVAAAALKCDASHIVTFNGRDFRDPVLATYGMAVVSPDDFLLALFRADALAVRGALASHRSGLSRPPCDPAEYRRAFERAGLVKSARRLSGS